MSVIERDDPLVEEWNEAIGRLHLLVNRPAEGLTMDELLTEAERQLKGAVGRVAKLEAALVAQEREMDQLRELAGVRKRYHDAIGGQ